MTALADALSGALGGRIDRLTPVHGGSINDAYRADLDTGGSVFVKTHRDPPPDFFGTEAAAIAWLEKAADGSVRVPSVLAARDEPPAFLALEWLTPGRSTPASDDAVGRGLAQLHRAGAPHFGWDRDGYIGDLRQPNPREADWPTFYREHRLAPLTRRAVDQGHLPSTAMEAVDRLGGRLDDLAGPAEPPARLHGDLWSGNLLVDDAGRPWAIDPAPYGGHREMDLAMMRLFGGFGPRCFASYDEAFPLAEGHDDRVALYQLYPLLVHVVLFGSGYADRTMAALGRYR